MSVGALERVLETVGVVLGLNAGEVEEVEEAMAMEVGLEDGEM